MIKTLFCCLALTIMTTNAIAQNRIPITVAIGAAATQSNVPLMLKTFEVANEIQQQYHFRAEFKPGAQGVIAVRHMDSEPQNRIASVAANFVENVRSGQLVEDHYVPVNALGDSCWALITNVGDTKRGISSLQSLRGQEITVGGTGFGNVAHLTSLMLAERYGFTVRYVVYKSNFDALINMVGDNSINLVLERVASYTQFRDKNPRLQILGMSCPTRHPSMPEIATLGEQGLQGAPMVWNAWIANRQMDAQRRRDIARIMDRAQQQIGRNAMFEMADVLAPQFSNISTDDYWRSRVDTIKTGIQRYQSKIDQAKQ